MIESTQPVAQDKENGRHYARKSAMAYRFSQRSSRLNDHIVLRYALPCRAGHCISAIRYTLFVGEKSGTRHAGYSPQLHSLSSGRFPATCSVSIAYQLKVYAKLGQSRAFHAECRLGLHPRCPSSVTDCFTQVWRRQVQLAAVCSSSGMTLVK